MIIHDRSTKVRCDVYAGVGGGLCTNPQNASIASRKSLPTKVIPRSLRNASPMSVARHPIAANCSSNRVNPALVRSASPIQSP